MQKTSSKICVAIVEDNPEIRKYLEEMILSEENFNLIASYDNCEAALQELERSNPEVILMDIELPGMNGIEGTQLIKQKRPNVEIIMITVLEQSEHVFAALQAGASGYLTKASNREQIINAILEAKHGGAPMSSRIARMVINVFSKKTNSPLTSKENQILNLLAKGKSYKSIAIAEEISVDTVKFHIKNIYIKLQVNNKEDAIETARKNNWLNQIDL